MKICFISNSVTFFTGFGQQIRLLSKKFSELGHEVFNLCEGRTAEDTPWIQEIAFNRFQIHPYDQELARIKPDVVIVLDGYNRNFDCANLAYTGRCKFFFWFPYESVIPLHQHRMMFRNVPENHVVFTSRFTQMIWEPYLKGPVIHHCIDTDLLSAPPDLENAEKLLRKLGLPNKKLICNVNRNEMRKRWDNFYKVIWELKNTQGQDFHGVVHSNDNGFYDFKDLEEYFGLGDFVTRTGFQFTSAYTKEDFRDLFSQMSLRVDTSSSEGFGLNVAEFAAMGIPQWVGNHTCMEEILGKDYPKFPCRDIYVSHFKNVYSELDLSEFPDVTLEHVRAARNHVIENFNPDKIVNEWLSLIEQTEISPKYKWGFNATEQLGSDLMNVAGFCSKIGGVIVEFGTHDGRFVDCCLYHGLDIWSLNNDVLPLSDRTKSRCISLGDKKLPVGNIAVITDYTVPAHLLKPYNWIVVRRKLTKQEIPEGFHRRLELESALINRYRFFSHEIYSKDPKANPLEDFNE